MWSNIFSFRSVLLYLPEVKSRLVSDCLEKLVSAGICRMHEYIIPGIVEYNNEANGRGNESGERLSHTLTTVG